MQPYHAILSVISTTSRIIIRPYSGMQCPLAGAGEAEPVSVSRANGILQSSIHKCIPLGCHLAVGRTIHFTFLAYEGGDVNVAGMSCLTRACICLFSPSFDLCYFRLTFH